MKWQVAILTVLVAVAVAGTWLWRDSVHAREMAEAETKRDTVTVFLPVTLPPPVVTPNPAPAEIEVEQDTAKIDSLVKAVKTKDALIRALLLKRSAEQKFESRKDSVTIVGTIDILYNPMYMQFKTAVRIDSLTVPHSVVTILKYITVNEIDWTWTAILSGFAFVVAFFLGISL